MFCFLKQIILIIPLGRIYPIFPSTVMFYRTIKEIFCSYKPLLTLSVREKMNDAKDILSKLDVKEMIRLMVKGASLLFIFH